MSQSVVPQAQSCLRAECLGRRPSGCPARQLPGGRTSAAERRLRWRAAPIGAAESGWFGSLSCLSWLSWGRAQGEGEQPGGGASSDRPPRSALSAAICTPTLLAPAASLPSATLLPTAWLSTHTAHSRRHRAFVSSTEASPPAQNPPAIISSPILATTRARGDSSRPTSRRPCSSTILRRPSRSAERRP